MRKNNKNGTVKKNKHVTKRESTRIARNKVKSDRQNIIKALNNEQDEKMLFDSMEQASTKQYPFAALKREGMNLDLTHDEIEMLNSILHENKPEYSTPLPSPIPNSSFDGIIDIGTPASSHIPPPLTPIIDDYGAYHPYADMNFDFKSSKGGNITKSKTRQSKRRTNKRFRKTRSKKQIGSGAQCSRPGFCINDELLNESWNGNSEKVRVLLNGDITCKAADVNATNNDGETALMLASKNSKTHTVKYLLERGADVNAKDNNGRTALSLASRREATEIVELINQHIVAEKEKDKKKLATGGKRKKRNTKSRRKR